MNPQKGFTLIELLVVVAIIGILSSVVLTMLNQGRARSRDGKRISDIKQIQVAIHLAETNNGSYPYDLASLVAGGFIPSLPKDPLTKQNYFYFAYASSDTSDQCTSPERCASYHLGANIEDVNALVLRSDADVDAGAGFIRGSDAGDCAGAFSGNHCYDLRP